MQKKKDLVSSVFLEKESLLEFKVKCVFFYYLLVGWIFFVMIGCPKIVSINGQHESGLKG